MAQGDFTLKVTADFSEVLAGFSRLKQPAEQAGTAVGKGLGDGIAAAGKTVDALVVQLLKLQQQKATLKVDTTEYKQAEQQIEAIKAEMAALRNQKLQLQADKSQIDKAAEALSGLSDEVGDSEDKLRLLDGVIAGFAATLSSGLVDGAQQAIAAVGGLVTEFAALDTEIRKAAGAAGEVGGYDKIATSVNKVGIEAAGTTLEVAKLATELVRGGMTIDQANDSLSAIVRGAEATGTSFDTMGSVVSASLKGFGLEASKATDIVDALVQGANASATDVTGMGNAFKYASPVARILGVDVKGLGTAIGLLANAGIDASEAGVTLRNGLSKLASAAPSTGAGVSELTGQAKMAADTMKTLGINIYNTDGTLKPMEQTILTLKGAFEKLDPASKIRLAANLFGGEDDGTKWLALLNQSETDIKKMAQAMADSKGATDTARDAMQGFEMKLKSLEGSIGSIGIAIGSVAAAALTPLVDAANKVVGAFAGLPEPAKNAIAAVGLLVGGITAATAAFVAFKAALQLAAVQSAITGIGSLAVAIGTTLTGAVAGAAAVIPGLITQLSLLGSVNVGAAIGAIATALKTTLSGALVAAGNAIASFYFYVTSISFSSFIASVGGIVAALAPLALAVGAVALAITTWQTILSGSQQVQKDFADAQTKSKDAADKLKIALDDQARAAVNAKNGWQQFLDFAKESYAIGELANQFSSLQAKFTAVQVEANKFYSTIQDSASLTTQESQRAADFTATLKQQADVMQTLIDAFKKKSEAALADANPTLAAEYTKRAAILEAELDVNKRLITAYESKIGKQAIIQSNTENQTKATEAQITAEQNLNAVIAAAPSRAYEQQINLGNQLVALTQSLSGLEQSRYSVIRSQLTYELQKAEERKLSESAINEIKRRMNESDAIALAARYRALQLEQELQEAILKLQQNKALIDADLDILEKRNAVLEAERKIKAATTLEAKAEAKAELDLANAMVSLSQSKKQALMQMQPIQSAIASIQAETADNALRAEAATMGLKVNADGSLSPMQSLATEIGKVATLSLDAKDNVEDYKDMARDAGLQVEIAKDGTIVLGQKWEDVNTQVGDLSTGIEDATGKTGKTEEGVDGIKAALEKALGPAADMVKAFTAAGDEAPDAVTAAGGFSSALSTAAKAGDAIKGIRLDTYMGAVSTNTGNAATAAQSFYNWLQRAANLPAARWTGGPVEAGEAYRVNELGQEALLSGGRLSLINAPSGGTWRAPSTGVVVPAGITAELQARGALPVRAARLTGGGSAIAEQAAVGAQQSVVLGKLQQAVDRLAAKEWNVNVTMRQGPTGSQVIKQLHGLL